MKENLKKHHRVPSPGEDEEGLHQLPPEKNIANHQTCQKTYFCLTSKVKLSKSVSSLYPCLISFLSLVGSFCSTSLGLVEISSNYMKKEDMTGNMEKLSKLVSILCPACSAPSPCWIAPAPVLWPAPPPCRRKLPSLTPF